jgi:hypothetical protein
MGLVQLNGDPSQIARHESDIDLSEGSYIKTNDGTYV